MHTALTLVEYFYNPVRSVLALAPKLNYDAALQIALLDCAIAIVGV